MRIKASFITHEWGIPPRCRKPRWQEKHHTITVDIPEASVIAPRVLEYQTRLQGTISLYGYEGKLYREVSAIDVSPSRRGFYQIDPGQESIGSFGRDPEYRDEAPFDGKFEDAKAAAIQDIQARASQHLVMDDRFWIEVDEPAIEFSHNSGLTWDAIELDFVSSLQFLQSHPRHTWRLSDLDKARDYMASQARKIRSELGDRITLLISDKVSDAVTVHRPDLLAYNPIKHHPRASETRIEDAKEKFAPDKVLALLHRFIDTGEIDVWEYGGAKAAIEHCLDLHFDTNSASVLDQMNSA